MQTNIIALIIIILIAVGAGGWWLMGGQNGSMDAVSMTEEGEREIAESGGMMEKESDAMMPKEEGTMGGESLMKDDSTQAGMGDGAMTPKQSEATAAENMDKPEDAMMSKGSYEAYAPEKLSKARDGDVVLFFRASWCPTCRALNADIQSHLGDIPAGVTILDVDYDNSTALKQKYGVTYQHTLVQVDASGNMIAKWSKSSTLSDLLANIK
jgi:thioredoxin 1